MFWMSMERRHMPSSDGGHMCNGPSPKHCTRCSLASHRQQKVAAVEGEARSASCNLGNSFGYRGCCELVLHIVYECDLMLRPEVGGGKPLLGRYGNCGVLCASRRSFPGAA